MSGPAPHWLELLAAAKNLENDDGSIPEHAWKPLQDAIAKVEEHDDKPQ